MRRHQIADLIEARRQLVQAVLLDGVEGVVEFLAKQEHLLGHHPPERLGHLPGIVAPRCRPRTLAASAGRTLGLGRHGLAPGRNSVVSFILGLSRSSGPEAIVPTRPGPPARAPARSRRFLLTTKHLAGLVT